LWLGHVPRHKFVLPNSCHGCIGYLGHLVGYRAEGTARQTPVRLWPLADILLMSANVRFLGQSRHAVVHVLSAFDPLRTRAVAAAAPINIAYNPAAKACMGGLE